jgi:hypothetical protein
MVSNNPLAGYLLYCIYNHGAAGPDAGLTGVQEQMVETVSTDGLGAAVSALHGAIPGSRVTELKRYGQVVAACHQRCATIPMRFGSIFRDKREIVCHLEEHGHAYQTLLRKLTDREEMGIRLLLPALRPPWPPDGDLSGKGIEDRAAAQAPTFPGKAYLLRQKQRYGLTDGLIQQAEAVLFSWRDSFKGLFVEWRWERPQWIALQRAPILSAYFLVPRQNLAGFQETFVRISRRQPEKALLSGPWPPYNFVYQKKNEGDAHESITCCPR